MIKKALYSEGGESLNKLYENTKEIEKQGIQVVSLEKEQDANGNALVRMPYMKCETALTYLRGLFYSNRDLFIEKTRYDCVFNAYIQPVRHI